MRIRPATSADLPALTDVTLAAFRPLFEQHLPAQLDPAVFAHDHGAWEDGYRREVPGYLEPGSGGNITLAEDDAILGFVAWRLAPPDTGVLQLLATAPDAQRRGVGEALCRSVIGELKELGAAVVHIGTGGDAFHAPARRLYEKLGFRGYPVWDFTRAL